MKIFYCLLIARILMSCNGSESTTDTTTTAPDSVTASPNMEMPKRDTATLAGNWYLQPVLPSDTGAGRTPQLNIELAGKKFTGNTGCNSMSGNFDYTDSTIVFNERIMLTKMACTGYNEDAFIKNLLRVNHFEFDDSVLVLKVEEQEISRWSRTPVKPPVSNKL